MRFAALVAVLLPLAAHAMPTPRVVRAVDDPFGQLKTGLTQTKDAFVAIFNAAIKPPRQSAVADDTQVPRSTLALLLSIGGPVDQLGDALASHTVPANDTLAQITNAIASVHSVVVGKLTKDAKCMCANTKDVVCLNISNATDGLTSASEALAAIVSNLVQGADSKRR